jgi:hypothetical protein
VSPWCGSCKRGRGPVVLESGATSAFNPDAQSFQWPTIAIDRSPVLTRLAHFDLLLLLLPELERGPVCTLRQTTVRILPWAICCGDSRMQQNKRARAVPTPLKLVLVLSET